MNNLKTMSEEQLKQELDKANYRVSTIKNLIYTAFLLGFLSWVTAVVAFLFEATVVSNIFSVAGVLQSGVMAGFIAMGTPFEGKCLELKKEIKIREEIAKQTQEYQNEKTHTKTKDDDLQSRSIPFTKDDDLTKGL